MKRIICMFYFACIALVLSGCEGSRGGNVWESEVVSDSREVISAADKFLHYTYTVPAGFSYVGEPTQVNNTYALVTTDGAYKQRIAFHEQEASKDTPPETMLDMYEQSITETYGTPTERTEYVSGDRTWTVYVYQNYKASYADLNGYIYVWSDGADTLYAEIFGISPDSVIETEVIDDSVRTRSDADELAKYNQMIPDDWAEYDTTEEQTTETVVLNASTMEELKAVGDQFIDSIRRKSGGR